MSKAAIAAGRQPLQGHGIRIGAVLEYLLRGMPFEVMKSKGRWASDSFERYLRKHAQILAPYCRRRHRQHRRHDLCYVRRRSISEHVEGVQTHHMIFILEASVM
jgi:hypothetical protein